MAEPELPESGLPSTSVFIDQAFPMPLPSDGLNVTVSPEPGAELHGTFPTEFVAGDDDGDDDEFERLEAQARVLSKVLPGMELPGEIIDVVAPKITAPPQPPTLPQILVNDGIERPDPVVELPPSLGNSQGSATGDAAGSPVKTPAGAPRRGGGTDWPPSDIPLPSSMRAKLTPWSEHALRSGGGGTVSAGGGEWPDDAREAGSPPLHVPPAVHLDWHDEVPLTEAAAVGAAPPAAVPQLPVAAEPPAPPVPTSLASSHTTASHVAAPPPRFPLPLPPQPPPWQLGSARPTMAFGAVLGPPPTAAPTSGHAAAPPATDGVAAATPADPLAQIVRDRVGALNAEVARYQAAVAQQEAKAAEMATRAASLTTAQAAVQAEAVALSLARAELRTWRDGERSKLDAWKADVLAKLDRERRVAVRQARAAAATAAGAATSRSERAELESVRSDLEASRAALATAEARLRTAEERHRTERTRLQERIHTLEAELRARDEDALSKRWGPRDISAAAGPAAGSPASSAQPQSVRQGAAAAGPRDQPPPESPSASAAESRLAQTPLAAGRSSRLGAQASLRGSARPLAALSDTSPAHADLSGAGTRSAAAPAVHVAPLAEASSSLPRSRSSRLGATVAAGVAPSGTGGDAKAAADAPASASKRAQSRVSDVSSGTPQQQQQLGYALQHAVRHPSRLQPSPAAVPLGTAAESAVQASSRPSASPSAPLLLSPPPPSATTAAVRATPAMTPQKDTHDYDAPIPDLGSRTPGAVNVVTAAPASAAPGTASGSPRRYSPDRYTSDSLVPVKLDPAGALASDATRTQDISLEDAARLHAAAAASSSAGRLPPPPAREVALSPSSLVAGPSPPARDVAQSLSSPAAGPAPGAAINRAAPAAQQSPAEPARVPSHVALPQVGAPAAAPGATRHTAPSAFPTAEAPGGSASLEPAASVSALLKSHILRSLRPLQLRAGVRDAEGTAATAATLVSERAWEANGKVERRYQDGTRLVVFRNGTEKEQRPDGATIVRFSNGDIKRTAATEQRPDDASEYYFFNESRTLHTAYDAGGYDVYEFPSGQLELHWRGLAGAKEILYPDGTAKVTAAAAARAAAVAIRPAGTVQ